MIVIGDIMLDRWVEGSTKRISPEAPIPILKEHKQHETLGGAGNVALNCSHLRMPTTLYGAVGFDKSGDVVKNLLKKTYIHFHYMPWMACAKTTTKTRFVETSQKVEKGELLFEIDPIDAKTSYDQALQRLTSLRIQEIRLSSEVLGEELKD